MLGNVLKYMKNLINPISNNLLHISINISILSKQLYKNNKNKQCMLYSNDRLTTDLEESPSFRKLNDDCVDDNDDKVI